MFANMYVCLLKVLFFNVYEHCLRALVEILNYKAWKWSPDATGCDIVVALFRAV